MSRPNKVNPGQYTQAGRLTPDDNAREMKKQRELAPPAEIDAKPHPFHPGKPRERDENELDDDREVSAPEPETDAPDADDDDDAKH
jgi:hypothetical protein